jgi:hypothetical protein
MVRQHLVTPRYTYTLTVHVSGYLRKQLITVIQQTPTINTPKSGLSFITFTFFAYVLG